MALIVGIVVGAGIFKTSALARDFRLFRWLDYWHAAPGTPLNMNGRLVGMPDGAQAAADQVVWEKVDG